MVLLFFRNALCYTVSIIISSYLLLSSFVFVNNGNFPGQQNNKVFEQVLEIPVKKDCKEFSCGYLKFLASSNSTGNSLKSKILQLHGPFFLPGPSVLAFDFSNYTPQNIQFVYSPPDRQVLNCSFLI